MPHCVFMIDQVSGGVAIFGPFDEWAPADKHLINYKEWCDKNKWRIGICKLVPGDEAVNVKETCWKAIP